MVADTQFTVTENDGVWVVRVIEGRQVQEFRCATADQVQRLLMVLSGNFEIASHESHAQALA